MEERFTGSSNCSVKVQLSKLNARKDCSLGRVVSGAKSEACNGLIPSDLCAIPLPLSSSIR